MDLQHINWPLLHLLLLIIVANGGPLILGRLLRRYGDQPVDFNLVLADGYPLFGPSKTWRGLLAALVLTAITAHLLAYPAQLGAYIAVLAMTGDLISSFIKRRLKKPSSTQVIWLDGLPECVLPLVFMIDRFSLQWSTFLMIFILFVVVELGSSKLLQKIHLRSKPHQP